MSRFFLKLTKISLWVLVPIIFISGTKFNGSNTGKDFFSGEYIFQTSGILNQNLMGIVNFETITEVKANGERYSILKLSLNNLDQSEKHTMQFLISKPDSFGQISRGTYDINKSQNSFIDNFDGVFGFADIEILGELPYFAKSGEIQISGIDEASLRGTLKLKLKNADNNFFDINGDFVAIKKQQ